MYIIVLENEMYILKNGKSLNFILYLRLKETLLFLYIEITCFVSCLPNTLMSDPCIYYKSVYLMFYMLFKIVLSGFYSTG